MEGGYTKNCSKFSLYLWIFRICTHIQITVSNIGIASPRKRWLAQHECWRQKRAVPCIVPANVCRIYVANRWMEAGDRCCAVGLWICVVCYGFSMEVSWVQYLGKTGQNIQFKTRIYSFRSFAWAAGHNAGRGKAESPIEAYDFVGEGSDSWAELKMGLRELEVEVKIVYSFCSWYGQ